MRGLGTVLLVLLAHVPASRTVSLRARAGEMAMVVEGGEMRFKPLQEDAPGGLTVIGKLHRCTYTGPADQLSVYLSDAQKGKNPDDFYFTRKRSDGYWQHLFIESECTGGLPPQDSPCLSSRHKGQHCGRDEDWSVLANDDFDGPGVLWRNEETCDPMQHNTNASITVDYFCPNQDNCKFLHRCSYDGPPKPVSQVAVLMDQKLNSNDHYSGNAAAGQVNDGYMAHTFAPAHCQNGLPPKGKDVSCVTSLRWAESCGGDHDWQALSRNDPAGPGVKWYTSHECNMARVAVDYFCPVGPTGGEFKKRLHTCKVGIAKDGEGGERGIRVGWGGEGGGRGRDADERDGHGAREKCVCVCVCVCVCGVLRGVSPICVCLCVSCVRCVHTHALLAACMFSSPPSLSDIPLLRPPPNPTPNSDKNNNNLRFFFFFFFSSFSSSPPSSNSSTRAPATSTSTPRGVRRKLPRGRACLGRCATRAAPPRACACTTSLRRTSAPTGSPAATASPPLLA